MNLRVREKHLVETATRTARPPKCLIVDDLEENLVALRALLKTENVEVIAARNGVEALHLMLAHDFALALVDIQMPEMDGFELAELMRSSDRTRSVPIIFVTAGVSQAERVFKGYELGAVDFIIKPVEPRILRSKAKFFFEIYEQKQKLVEAEERFRSLFQGAGVGIANVGLDGEWLKANAKFLEILGHDTRFTPSGNWTDRLHPTERLHELKEIARLLSGDVASYSAEKRLRRDDGRYVWTLMTVSLVRSPGGLPADIIISAQDISALKAAQDEAAAANKVKAEFLANMSHEIRTPMTAILGFSEMLASAKLPDAKKHDFIHKIRSNSDHLLHLLDDILDLAKADASKANSRPFDLGALVTEACQALDSMAKKKSVRLKVEIDSNVPSSIFSDPHRIRQILNNLVGNAIKFTDRGDVRIYAARTGQDLEISVRDCGVGIQKESFAKIFEPFEQADSSTTRRFGGTGLGLALSRKTAQALGGDIDLRWSEVGQGAEFVLKIPVMQSTSPREMPTH